jgi:putative ABC transport system permease protein
MVGVGQGANEQVQARMSVLGTNTLQIEAGSGGVGGIRGGLGSIRTLVVDDANAILRQVPGVVRVTPGANGSVQVIYGNQNWPAQMQGVNEWYFQMRGWEFAQGGTFTLEDVEQGNNVVVIGTEVAQNLFGEESPIGKTVRIKNLPFRVVGLPITRGQSGMGANQDDRIFMPYTTAQRKILGTNWLSFIQAQAVSREATFLVQRNVEELLRDRHRIRPGAPDDFRVRNNVEVAQLADESSQVMTLMLAAVASVSLLVGGIGIMNIMLVSVTERTREIGIRMAIGATEADVQAQFLIEAIVLSLFGGLLGIIFGLASSKILANLLQWPSRISVVSIAVSVVFSAAMGIFFGLYPARKAARLDPIDALRYE